jgi:hypothetical protein
VTFGCLISPCERVAVFGMGSLLEAGDFDDVLAALVEAAEGDGLAGEDGAEQRHILDFDEVTAVRVHGLVLQAAEVDGDAVVTGAVGISSAVQGQGADGVFVLAAGSGDDLAGRAVPSAPVSFAFTAGRLALVVDAAELDDLSGHGRVS